MKPELLSLLNWKDIRTIIEASESFPLRYPDERAYYNDILAKVRETNKDERVERYLYLTAKAEAATGAKATRRRDYFSVLTRSFVSRQLWREGMSYKEIARISGRNHATIMHQVKTLEDMAAFPKMYEKELEMYNKFIESIEHAEQE